MGRDNRHEPAHLFEAICHARNDGTAIIMPSFNAEALGEHFKEIGAQVAPARAPSWCATAPANTSRANGLGCQKTSLCCR